MIQFSSEKKQAKKKLFEPFDGVPKTDKTSSTFTWGGLRLVNFSNFMIMSPDTSTETPSEDENSMRESLFEIKEDPGNESEVWI